MVMIMSLTAETPMIDLHGCRKEQAISDVTEFLHQVVRKNNNTTHNGKLWVCIITGSGHHSHGGPVLREAVRSLLDKREMEYTIQYGKGSFMVNACSGHELTAGPMQPSDTKVIVKPSSNEHNVRLINRATGNSSTTAHSSSSNILVNMAAPKPCEVAQDDELVARIKLNSQQEHRQAQRTEYMQLKQALTASKRALEWELELDARQEEEHIATALQQSEQEDERIQREEEERLKQMLRLSLEEEERIKREEEERLAAVLQESQLEEERKRKEEEALLERALSTSVHEVSQADVVLKEALQHSMQEVHAVDSDLNKALSLSLKESEPPDEDILLKQAIQLSITEATAEVIEEVDYYSDEIIEEVD